MIHHPSGVARGQASDINRECIELLRVRDYMDRILAQATGQTFDKVARDFRCALATAMPLGRFPGPWFPVPRRRGPRVMTAPPPPPSAPWDFRRNMYFDTKEAKEYGLIDNIVRPGIFRVSCRCARPASAHAPRRLRTDAPTCV